MGVRRCNQHLAGLGFVLDHHMKTTSLAAFAVILALSLGTSSFPLGPQAADARPIARSARGRVVTINRRPYLVTLNLRVVTGGAPLDPLVPVSMQCTATLTAIDGRPVGRLPGRLTLSLTSRGERRAVVLELIPSDVQQPIETAAYSASVAPFEPNDAMVNAMIGSGDRIGFRPIFINNLPVEVVLLPVPFLPD
jgi:hypothetical protein